MSVSHYFLRAVPFVALLAGATLAGAPVHAQTVVFDNGTPNNTTSFLSDRSAATQFIPQRVQVDTFTLTSTTTVNAVEWFGAYVGANTLTATTDNFVIEFFNTAAGSPNTISFSSFDLGTNVNRAISGGTTQGVTNYSYRGSLGSGVTLTAGTYAIGITNNTYTDTDDNWYWLGSSTAGGSFASSFNFSTGQTTITPVAGETAFRLIGPGSSASAPEPGTLALLGMGLVSSAGFTVRRCRK